jgi:5-methylcytosine-specific restriction endonuclease McrA
MGSLRNGGAWTEGRYKGFITGVLRSGMRRWPPKWECLKSACTGQKVNKKTKRLAKHFRCNECKRDFPQKSVQVDHINPVGSCSTWDEYIERLFCEADNLQVLCKPCHKKKTNSDNQTNRQRGRKRSASRRTRANQGTSSVPD